MPWADTPVAMQAATMVRMSSVGRPAAQRRRNRLTARNAVRRAKKARASSARVKTPIMTVSTGWSDEKVVI
jgi:hypothetical protein